MGPGCGSFGKVKNIESLNGPHKANIQITYGFSAP